MPDTTPKVWMPIAMDDLSKTFPTHSLMEKLLPPWNEIPQEFKQFSPNDKWQNFIADWFYFGIKDLKITTKPGIEINTAIRHIGAILSSFAIKHEHKEAGCAYLASLWFEDASYAVKERNT